MTKYSIEEIRNYIISQPSLGDVLYFLSEENINKANKPKEKCRCEDSIDESFCDFKACGRCDGTTIK